AIRLRVLVSARPGVIDSPEGGVIPVGVYAVAAAGVGPAILPPVSTRCEGVLVAVRVLDRNHPDIVRADQCSARIRQPTNQLHGERGRDPFACVMRAEE